MDFVQLPTYKGKSDENHFIFKSKDTLYLRLYSENHHWGSCLGGFCPGDFCLGVDTVESFPRTACVAFPVLPILFMLKLHHSTII